jgi:hypothetical protein
MQKLDQTFKNKQISVRLRKTSPSGDGTLHGECIRVTASGLLLKPDSQERIFVTSDQIDLFWVSQ